MMRFQQLFVTALAILMLLAGCASKELQTPTDPQIRQFVFDDITVSEIIDSPLRFDTGIWPDIEMYPDRLAEMPGGVFETDIKTFLVVKGGRIVLIDAGVGKEHYVTQGSTLENLRAAGVMPEQVTDILMTHLDIDHIGGLISGVNAVFPNARLHISRPEYEAWTTGKGLVNRLPEHKRLITTVVLPAYAGRLQLFDYGDTILPGIVALDAAGHTPGHTAFEITCGNRGMLVAGDFMHVAPIQLRTPEYSTIWDAEPQAGQTRRRILERLGDSGLLLAAMHVREIGYVRRSPDGGYSIIPVQ